MLITFSCDAYENITMFGDVAKKLLNLMDQSPTVPGAIRMEDIPEALANLKKGLQQDKYQNAPKNQDDDEDEEDPISLAHRAIPLVNMLEAAAKAHKPILWS